MNSGSFLFEKKHTAHLVDNKPPHLLLGIPHTPKNQFKGMKTWSLNFWAILSIGQLRWSVYYFFVTS